MRRRRRNECHTQTTCSAQTPRACHPTAATAATAGAVLLFAFGLLASRGWCQNALPPGVDSTTAAATAATRSTDSAPFHVGVCSHFGQNKGVPELGLRLMKAAGINALRDELSWGSVERNRGQYALNTDRAAAFSKAAALGISPMLILDYANRHYDGGDRPRSAEALEGYAKYAEALIQRFGRDVSLYEVWNEYDIGIGMPEQFDEGGSPEDYVRMLKYVYPRVKQAAPWATVVGGAPTPGGVRRGWLEKIIELGALEHCDLLSIHTYNYSAGPSGRTPESWHTWMKEVQAMLRSHRGGEMVPLLVTEMGWPTHVGPRGTHPELSASYLGRLYLLARSLPYLRGIWWYDYQDDGWDREENEHNFGIVRPDLTPKPAYHVMADVAPLAARGRFLGRLSTDDPEVWILRFAHRDQEVWAVWTADDRPRQLLLQTEAPETPLVIHKLGHKPVARGWGYRAWAKQGRQAQLDLRRASLVIGDRPWLLSGGMQRATVLDTTDLLGSAAARLSTGSE